MREMPASSAAALNELKCRTLCPIEIAVLSSNGTSPISAVSTVAAAADCVEWPDGYSGKGGVGMSGSQVESMRRRMYVRGRIRLYWYLYPQDATNASACAAAVSTMARAASSAERLRSLTIWLAIEIQCSTGVPDSPALSAQ